MGKTEVPKSWISSDDNMFIEMSNFEQKFKQKKVEKFYMKFQTLNFKKKKKSFSEHICIVKMSVWV